MEPPEDNQPAWEELPILPEDANLAREALHIQPDSLRYRALIGTGGIGSGSFFALGGDHTLGREESRSGRFLDRRDYCKLHIIAHYVRTLLGADFTCLPLGKVGDDAVGRGLLEEMAQAGLDVRYVEATPGEQTLFSFCFTYPDGSGGNLTVDNSASSLVDTGFIERAEAEFEQFAGQGIALTVPEVPLAAREAVLRLGRQYQFLTVAAFTSEEIRSALEMGLIEMTDLLAINLHEAEVVAWLEDEDHSVAGQPTEVRSDGGMPAEYLSTKDRSTVEIVEAAVARLTRVNPRLLISITAGKEGCWGWDGSRLEHLPALPVPVAGTAGAGDAHLAGIISGLAAGLSFFEAQELGNLAAALSVTSPHTIHPGLDRQSLAAMEAQLHAVSSPAILRWLH